VELVALRTLYERDHLDQVLATFGLILFFNELVAIVWGRNAIFSTIPEYLSGHVELFAGLRYPLYRLVIILIGFAVAGLLWFVVVRTRLGMLIRCRASNRTMVGALRRQHPVPLYAGVRIRRGTRGTRRAPLGPNLRRSSRAWAS
jgi:branched-chain amino acid transport system permease protein